MTLICPKCGKPIEDDNILDSRDLAFCASCGEMLTISSLNGNQPVPGEAKTAFTQEEGIQQLSKIIAFKNTVIDQLNAEKKRLGDEKAAAFSENQRLKEKIGTPKNIFAAVIVLVILSMVIFAIAATYKYNGIKRQKNSEIKSLQTKYDNLLEKYEESKSLWVFEIVSIEIGNWSNDRWVSAPGEPLYSEKMRYLRPRIIYNSNINDNVIFYVSIFDPEGDLLSGRSSPEGFTFVMSPRWISRGFDRPLDLSYWGNNNSSEYGAGRWKIEIWYKIRDKTICLISEDFDIIE